MSGLAGAIIGAGATIAAGTASAVSSGKANKRGEKLAKHLNASNQQFTREINDLNYQRAMEQWHLENAYNSPKSQMQRYQEAGLNPNLIYGQQNLGSSINSPAAQASASNFDEATLASQSGVNLNYLGDAVNHAVNMYQQTEQFEQSLDNLRLQNKSLRLDNIGKDLHNQGVLLSNDNTIKQGQGLDLKNQYQSIVNKYYPKQAAEQIRAVSLANDKQEALRDYGAWQTELSIQKATLDKLIEDVSMSKLSRKEKNRQIQLLNDTYDAKVSQVLSEATLRELQVLYKAGELTEQEYQAAMKQPFDQIIYELKKEGSINWTNVGKSASEIALRAIYNYVDGRFSKTDSKAVKAAQNRFKHKSKK